MSVVLCVITLISVNPTLIQTRLLSQCVTVFQMVHKSDVCNF